MYASGTLTEENPRTWAVIILEGAAAGAPCGLRSMMPLYFLSRSLAAPPPPAAAQDLGLLAPLVSPVAERTLGTAVVGEVLADKAPFIPARTEALPLLGRLLSGALAGAAATTSTRTAAEPQVSPGALTPALLVAALAGAAGALATTFAGHRLRRAITTRTRIPDLAVAVAEDLLCLAWSSAVARRAAR